MKQKWGYMCCPCCGNCSARKNVHYVPVAADVIGKDLVPRIKCPVCAYVLDEIEEDVCTF